MLSKDQENPNFSAFDTLGSLSNDPVLDPGRLGKRSDGTKITKLYAKPDVERVKKLALRKMHAKSNRRYRAVLYKCEFPIEMRDVISQPSQRNIFGLIANKILL